MMPESIRPHQFGTAEQELWEDYSVRLGMPDDEAVRQFYRQVPFDHFDKMNGEYFEIDLSRRKMQFVEMTVNEIADRIRYFDNKPLDFWFESFDSFPQDNFEYVIYENMTKNLTFPFPPIIIDSIVLESGEGRDYGHPIHLIEGTHRVSYLLRMLQLRLVEGDSKHTLVLLS